MMAGKYHYPFSVNAFSFYSSVQIHRTSSKKLLLKNALEVSYIVMGLTREDILQTRMLVLMKS